MQRLLLLLVKIAVTGLLIFWSVRTVSLQAVVERLGDVKLAWLLLVLAILAVQIVLQSVRWRCVVQAYGKKLSDLAMIRMGFIAAFFNQTLISTIGGDAVRIWMLARHHQTGWRIAAYSVFTDRAIGVFALALLVTTCLPWTFTMVQDPIARLAVAAIGAGGILGGIVFAALSAAKGTRLSRLWGMEELVAASSGLRQLAASGRIATFVAIASIAIHLLTVAAAWSAAQSIGAKVSLLQLACIVPPIVLLAIAPVTIAGWGLRESLMITGFTLAGLQAGDALVISLLLGTTNFLVGLIGGGLWLSGRVGTPQEHNADGTLYDRR